MSKSNSNKEYFSKPLIVLVGIGIFLAIFINYERRVSPTPSVQSESGIVPIKLRSKPSGLIKKVSMPSKNFSIQESAIVTNFEFNPLPGGITLSIILYRNGNYAGFESIEVPQEANSANLNMQLKDKGFFVPGEYLQKVYVNGVFETAIVFSIN